MTLRLCSLCVLFFGVTIATPSQTTQRNTPMTPPLKGVQYVMLGVANIDRSIAFYQGKLGLKVRRVTDDLVFIDTETISLVISTEVGKAAGDSEIVFAVDHVRQSAKALRDAGITLTIEPHAVTDKSWAAAMLDPDGHVLSVFGPE